MWWLGGALLLLLAGVAAAINIAAHRAEPYVRARVIEALSDRFHAKVELDSFHLSLGNSLHGEWGVWAEGRGLRIWPPALVEGVSAPQPSGPIEPLIRLGEFRFHAPLRYKSGEPVRIAQVRLKGLDIHFPPHTHFQRAAQSPPATTPGLSGTNQWGDIKFKVDNVECTGANLVLGTDKPNKLPLEFAIAHLKLTGVVPGAPFNFEAEITNPRPPGVIHSKGSFGPWDLADPGESPIMGDYRFNHADLSVFTGIAGVLDSTGRYEGTLRNLTVDGETDTPDFQITQYGHTMPLHTRFHARVDGTNGDTWLEPVDATLSKSHFTAQGQIVRVLATDSNGSMHSVGHDIALNVNVGRSRIEDFMRLATSPPTAMLTGDVNVKAALHIPPGTGPAHERMTLKGRFVLDKAEFASAYVRDRIKDLSLRGQGRPGDLKIASTEGVKSHMQGDFQLGGGVLTLPALTYSVPGADIDLTGSYGLNNGKLNFIGTAKMQATISQMVGGWKGKLLRPADRFFKKDGAGTSIPIYVSGTREKPEFGYSERKSTRPERPGATAPPGTTMRSRPIARLP